MSWWETDGKMRTDSHCVPFASGRRLQRGSALVAILVIVTLFWGGSDRTAGQSGAPTILLIVNGTSPNLFGGYLAEILRAEGVNSFSTSDLSTVASGTLTGVSLVVLVETSLTPGQATMFDNYVAGGGRLIAMRPDIKLAQTLGIVFSGNTLNNPYLSINNATQIGAGFTATTLPLKGLADRYTLANGATSVATLYSNQNTPTANPTNPAVVRFGHTATWAFDLARSVVYTRQGDPANGGQDRDGLPPIRTVDLFHNAIDKDRINLPHADINMRLFSRVVRELLADQLPLPRLWYFPGTNKTLMIVTSDGHTHTPANYTSVLSAVQARGGRLTFYLSRFVDAVTSQQVATWRANGHEVGLHPYFYQDNATVEQGYSTVESWFSTQGWGQWSPTVRHHQIEWPTWVGPAQTMLQHGIRMDTSFYTWGPAVTYPNGTQGHGFINGSALPMRFISQQGTIIAVYQQCTSLIDEQLVRETGDYTENLSASAALVVSQQLVNASQNGEYSAITTQFHADYYPFGGVQPWVDGTLDIAANAGIPLWTVQHWLAYNEARVATVISGLSWSPATNRLTFQVAVPAGAEAQSMTLPTAFGGQTLSGVTVDGAAAGISTQAITGQSTAFFSVAPAAGGAARTVVATYDGAPLLPTLVINSVTVPEGNSGTTPASFTVSLSAPSNQTVTAQFATSNGSATAGSDYQSASGTVTFPPNSTSQIVSVDVFGDGLDEPDETFNVTLSAPVNATIATATGTATILDDDDALPSLSIGDVSVTEGNSGAVGAVFTVTLSSASAQTVTVTYGTADVTAAAPGDYSTTSGTVTFTPQQTTQTVTVPVIGDTTFEGTETFNVNLTSPTNASIADGTGVGTIVDDDGPVGSVTATYAVTAAGDDVNENGTSFVTDSPSVWLGNASSTTASYTGLRFTNVTIPRNATVTAARLDVRAAATQWLGVTFEYAAEAGGNSAAFSTTSKPSQRTLLAPRVTHSQNVQWVSGTWYSLESLTALIQAVVNQGTWSTGNSLALVLHGTGGAWGRKFVNVYEGGAANSPRLVVTYSGGGPPPVPTLSVNDVTVTEGTGGTTTATFTVTLSAASSQTVTVDYATAPGTATAGIDYTTTGGQLTFTPNQTSLPVTVPIATDSSSEGSESFTLGLSNPGNATIADGTGAATIVDDDTPSLSINDATVTEGDGGSVDATFTVTLSPASGQVVTVGYQTANGTASAGTDFTAASGTLTFGIGVTSQTVTVPVLGDTLDEANESFFVNLSNPTNAAIGDAQGIGTITDNDPPPSITINDVTVTEGDSGSVSAGFTVTLSAASGQGVTVGYTTANGSASSGADYTTTSGTLTFAAGVTTQPVTVPALGDLLDEQNETFLVNLSGPTNATLGDGQGQGTITDNDPTPSLTINDVSVTEGTGSTTTATFTVTLSAASGQTVTVGFATADGTAIAPADYTSTSGTLTFAPGQTTQPVAVAVVTDTAVESSETFTVGLSGPSNATIVDGTGQGTIVDDDVPTGTQVTVTVQIAAGADDVNQDGTALATGATGVWLGTGSSTTSSYAGLRFVNVALPRNVTVTSARLEVNAAATQWQTMAFEYAVEASGNSAAFAAGSLPGNRTLLTPRVAHSSNIQWTGNTWYQLEQLAPLVQALVQRADWASGNALALILRGTGGAWGRKFAKTYENTPSMAPRLVITYTTP